MKYVTRLEKYADSYLRKFPYLILNIYKKKYINSKSQFVLKEILL
mgnify:CR=1 FL=1